MAAPFFSTPFQPFVYQSPQDAVTPFQILGGEAQIVQIMLKPQERIIAKPGSMCYMSGSIQMENVYAAENEAGVWQWLFGKNTTSIVLHNTGTTDGFVGIAAPSLARILPIDLAKFGGEILCQPDAFLCSINDVKVSNTIDQRPRNLVASAEGFLRQKISGQGLAFVVGGGSGMILKLTSPINLELYGNILKMACHEQMMGFHFHFWSLMCLFEPAPCHLREKREKMWRVQ